MSCVVLEALKGFVQSDLCEGASSAEELREHLGAFVRKMDGHCIGAGGDGKGMGHASSYHLGGQSGDQSARGERTAPSDDMSAIGDEEMDDQVQQWLTENFSKKNKRRVAQRQQTPRDGELRPLSFVAASRRGSETESVLIVTGTDDLPKSPLLYDDLELSSTALPIGVSADGPLLEVSQPSNSATTNPSAAGDVNEERKVGNGLDGSILSESPMDNQGTSSLSAQRSPVNALAIGAQRDSPLQSPVNDRKVLTTGQKDTVIPQSPNQATAPIGTINDVNKVFQRKIECRTCESRLMETPDVYVPMLETFNIPVLTDIDDQSFDVMELWRGKPNSVLLYVGANIFLRYHMVASLGIDARKLVKFLSAVNDHYRSDNPYHNGIHGADVLHTTHIMLQQPHVGENFTDIELFTLLFAALVHDVGHLGVSNTFLAASDHYLHKLYSTSPLECMHASLAFFLLEQEENFFLPVVKTCKKSDDAQALRDSSGHPVMSVEEYTRFKSDVRDVVVQTDMKYHSGMIQSVIDIFEDGIIEDDEVPKLMIAIVHLADVSNPLKVERIYQQWIGRVLHEFWRQGDAEKDRGFEISAMCDRDSALVAPGQVGFIKFVLRPLVSAMKSVVPPEWFNNMQSNLRMLDGQDDKQMPHVFSGLMESPWHDISAKSPKCFLQMLVLLTEGAKDNSAFHASQLTSIMYSFVEKRVATIAALASGRAASRITDSEVGEEASEEPPVVLESFQSATERLSNEILTYLTAMEESQASFCEIVVNRRGVGATKKTGAGVVGAKGHVQLNNGVASLNQTVGSVSSNDGIRTTGELQSKDDGGEDGNPQHAPQPADSSQQSSNVVSEVSAEAGGILREHSSVGSDTDFTTADCLRLLGMITERRLVPVSVQRHSTTAACQQFLQQLISCWFELGKLEVATGVHHLPKHMAHRSPQRVPLAAAGEHNVSWQQEEVESTVLPHYLQSQRKSIIPGTTVKEVMKQQAHGSTGPHRHGTHAAPQPSRQKLVALVRKFDGDDVDDASDEAPSPTNNAHRVGDGGGGIHGASEHIAGAGRVQGRRLQPLQGIAALRGSGFKRRPNEPVVIAMNNSASTTPGFLAGLSHSGPSTVTNSFSLPDDDDDNEEEQPRVIGARKVKRPPSRDTHKRPNPGEPSGATPTQSSSPYMLDDASDEDEHFEPVDVGLGAPTASMAGHKGFMEPEFEGTTAHRRGSDSSQSTASTRPAIPHGGGLVSGNRGSYSLLGSLGARHVGLGTQPVGVSGTGGNRFGQAGRGRVVGAGKAVPPAYAKPVDGSHVKKQLPPLR